MKVFTGILIIIGTISLVIGGIKVIDLEYLINNIDEMVVLLLLSLISIFTPIYYLIITKFWITESSTLKKIKMENEILKKEITKKELMKKLNENI